MSNCYSDELLVLLIKAVNINSKAILDADFGGIARIPERKRHRKDIEEIEQYLNNITSGKSQN